MPTARRVTAPLDAYVLHRYDWSETSLILDLFTRAKGRVTVAAKGAKRPYSQLRSVLLPFQRLSATIGKQAEDAKSDVVTLRSAEWAGVAPTRARVTSTCCSRRVAPPARLTTTAGGACSSSSSTRSPSRRQPTSSRRCRRARGPGTP